MGKVVFLPKPTKTIRRVLEAGRTDKTAAKMRQLYARIESGARAQQRIQRMCEKRFFDHKFDSRQLVEEARKFGGSERQQIELREYAKRLARNRNAILRRYKAWGIGKEHIGRPMAGTPSGISAETMLYRLTGWRNLRGRIGIVPYRNMIAFNVGKGNYERIRKAEFPKSRGNEAVFLIERANEALKIMIAPDLKSIEREFAHEKKHVGLYETPLNKELLSGAKKGFNPRTLVQSFWSTDLRLGSKHIGRDMLNELIANIVKHGSLNIFEESYRTDYVGEYSTYHLGPKTAAAFMRNKGSYKSRLFEATAKSIKAVKHALSAYVVDPRTGKRVKVISREELAALLANIRDMHRVPQRLPVLVEMRRKRLKQRMGVK